LRAIDAEHAGHAKQYGRAGCADRCPFESDRPGEIRADFALANPAFAVLVTSAIARGSIAAIDVTEARAVKGVLEIFTHLNCQGKLQIPELFADGGYAATTILPLDTEKIWHDGQIVAIVVADTFEAAREAAFKVEVSYHREQAMSVFDAEGVEICAVADIKSSYADPATGDAAAALSDADVLIDAEYETPTQHHNPI
jgi:xanthine dehydrogenase YagR molybdenum-binding subunit